MRKVLSFFLLIVVILGVSILRTRRSSPRGLYSRRQFLMGTLVEVKVAERGRRAEEAVNAALAEMAKIDSLASRTKRGDVFRLNKYGEAEVSRDTEQLIRRSLRYAHMTGGAFDPSVQPLLERWSHFEDSTLAIPGKEELAELLPLVDYRAVEMEGGWNRPSQIRSSWDEVRVESTTGFYPSVARVSFLVEGMGIDLGGVAKGYAIDKAAEMLESRGVISALVEAGGDIRAVGTKPDGAPWRIGLRHPRKNGLLTVFELSHRSICTSGDYEKFFERDGVRYHHLLDPRTGYPAGGCCSVTIIAADATTADALSTGAFVLGPERGIALIDSLTDVEGVIVSERDGDLEIKISRGLEGKLDFNP